MGGGRSYKQCDALEFHEKYWHLFERRAVLLELIS
jgi:hypothetical protein